MSGILSASKAAWALRILDAWAERHEVMSPAPCAYRVISRTDGASLCRWRIAHGVRAVGGHTAIYTSADAARIAAAEALVATDPSLASDVGEEPRDVVTASKGDGK